jgi:hypothetical protein
MVPMVWQAEREKSTVAGARERRCEEKQDMKINTTGGVASRRFSHANDVD